MGLYARDTSDGNGFDPVSQGMHKAICYGVYDLGTQFNEYFGKSSHRVLIQWELPEERIDVDRDGETVNLPRAQSKMYTLSLHEKANLRKDLESWRGRSFTAEELAGFDLQKLLGVDCQIQVIHKKKDDKTYANVSLVIPGIGKHQETENPQRFYSIDDHGTDIPDGTPEWIEKIIKDSDEWQSLQGVPLPDDDIPYADDPGPADDDIPF